MPSDWVVIDGRASGCSAEIWVNDIAVAQVGFGQSPRTVLPVNQYVISGANDLRLVVNPGPTPATALLPQAERRRAGEASASFTVSRYAPGSVTGDGTGVQLAQVEWSGRDDDEPESFPQQVEGVAAVDMELGPWAWQGADELTLDDATVGEVARIVDVVRDGLASADPGPFLEFGALGLQEIARAYGDTPDAGVATLRELVTGSQREPHWKFPPVPRPEWSLRLVARNRMVECLAADWRPIVRSITDDESNSFMLPMWVGRARGRWIIIR